MPRAGKAYTSARSRILGMHAVAWEASGFPRAGGYLPFLMVILGMFSWECASCPWRYFLRDVLLGMVISWESSPALLAVGFWMLPCYTAVAHCCVLWCGLPPALPCPLGWCTCIRLATLLCRHRICLVFLPVSCLLAILAAAVPASGFLIWCVYVRGYARRGAILSLAV